MGTYFNTEQNKNQNNKTSQKSTFFSKPISFSSGRFRLHVFVHNSTKGKIYPLIFPNFQYFSTNLLLDSEYPGFSKMFMFPKNCTKARFIGKMEDAQALKDSEILLWYRK